MRRRTLLKSAALAPAAVTTAWASEAVSATADEAHGYLVGAGMYDITGAVAETGAFGYAAGQEMTGFHSRLYARAFVVADKARSKRVAIVCCDTGAIFWSVKVGVLKALKARFGDTYVDDNVVLTATHTHSGNSGLSWDKLYQIAANDGAGYGWDKSNYSLVVAGIVEAIARADQSLEPGILKLASTEVHGATKNRASYPYKLNPDASQYASDVNTTMVQLNLTSAGGDALGVLNWFAIHPTAFPLNNTFINSDNKGYAEWLFERQMRKDPRARPTFVAAFANTDAGDVVSTQGNSKSAPGYLGSPDDFENVRTDAVRQYEPAIAMWGRGAQVSGPLDYRARWISLAGLRVEPEFTNGAGQQTLAVPARGWSFAAGGPNGPSEIPGIYPGMTVGSFDVGDTVNKIDTSALGTLTRLAFAAVSGLGGARRDPLQGDKPILLPDGAWGWTPKLTQVQLIRIGSLALVCVPGEITTMCGRRLRAAMLEELAPLGVRDVVLVCYANDYQGYTATPEEYAAQYYEGASTEYGPYQLPAFVQEFAGLARAMVSGVQVPHELRPADMSARMPSSRPGVVFDDVPPGQRFGQVLTEPPTALARGGTVSAVFRSGHPKNDPRTMGTFLEVQRNVGGEWSTWRSDRDWDTTYAWRREGVAYSSVTITWRIASDTPPGSYRLVHSGEWKHGIGGAVSTYSGSSRPFTVS